MTINQNDRHLNKMVAVRLPDDLREELKNVAAISKRTMNDIIIEGTREIIKKLKKSVSAQK
jgi:predicted DNA-binding protein